MPYLKTGKILLSFFLVILILVLSTLLFLTWRIHKDPIDVSFAKSFIESQLQNPDKGTYANIKQLMLYWPDLSGPLYLGLREAELYKENRVIFSINEAALGLAKAPLLIGIISPENLIIENPTLHIFRAENGSLSIGFDSQETNFTQNDSSQTEVLDRIIRFISGDNTEKSDSSPLSSLKSFQLNNASLIYKHESTNKTLYFENLNAELQSSKNGLILKADTRLKTNESKTPFIKSRLSYNTETKAIFLSGRVENLDFSSIGQLLDMKNAYQNYEGDLNLSYTIDMSDNLKVSQTSIDASSGSGTLSFPNEYDSPIAFKDSRIRFMYDKNIDKISIPVANITVNGVELNLEGNFNVDDDLLNVQYLEGGINIKIPELHQEKIESLWPKSVKEEKAREWLVEKMGDGVFKNLAVNTKFQIDMPNLPADDVSTVLRPSDSNPSISVSETFGSFSFEDMTINYKKPLLPAKNAYGHGTYDHQQEKLNVTIEKAKIQELDVNNAQLEFVHIATKGKGKADLLIPLKGPLKSVLDYVEKEPIDMKKKFDLSKVEGTTDLNINIAFPTVDDVKMKDIHLNVQGEMNSVRLPELIRSMDLTGGPFAVTVKDNLFSVTGNGKVDGLDVSATYEEFLKSAGQPYKSKVKAELIASTDTLHTLGVDLDDFLESTSIPLNITYTSYQDRSSKISTTMDLTSSRLFYEPILYEKPKGNGSKGNFVLNLQDGNLKKINEFNLYAPGLKIERGSMDFNITADESSLSAVNFKNFHVGKNKGSLDLKFGNKTSEHPRPITVNFSGSSLDLRPFLEEKEKDEETLVAPLEVNANADLMLTKDDLSIKNGKIYAKMDENKHFNQLEVDAFVGKGSLFLRYKPGISATANSFIVNADDAGATLSAFGLYDKIRGGKLKITAKPADKNIYTRNLIGSAKISDFKVVKAPSLARLLGAMSLTGVINLLEGEGVAFSKLEADFDWLYRPRGSVLLLKNGRTAGNSLGLTFDGSFDKGTDTIDVNGTIVPLSGINEIIGNIPLIGDILTGGSGSLIAATYKIKGNSKDPQVSVNPLSVLTPGILRRILFEENKN